MRLFWPGDLFFLVFFYRYHTCLVTYSYNLYFTSTFKIRFFSSGLDHMVETHKTLVTKDVVKPVWRYDESWERPSDLWDICLQSDHFLRTCSRWPPQDFAFVETGDNLRCWRGRNPEILRNENGLRVWCNSFLGKIRDSLFGRKNLGHDRQASNTG